MTAPVSLQDSLGSPVSIPIPPAQILALTSTLIVYPPLTTRLQEHEEPVSTHSAATYLELLNNLVGPRAAGFSEAFRYADQDGLGRRPVSAESDDAFQAVTTKAANQYSLFAQAGDFWAVVGWAFNCAHAHPLRWERWRHWLDITLDILTDDLLADSDPSTSILNAYLDVDTQGRGQRRRILRAIFANGSKKSLDEFTEIWRNETKPPKKTGVETKPKKLDIDADEFADYLDHDDELDAEDESGFMIQGTNRTRAKRRSAVHADDSPGSHTLDSIPFRQHLIAAIVAHTLSTDLFMSSASFLDALVEQLVVLPLDVFTHYVQPRSPYLCPDAAASLITRVLRELISADAQLALTTDDCDIHALCNAYLPYAANKSDASSNAKISLGLEALLVLIVTEGSCAWTEATRAKSLAAVQKGVSARVARVKAAVKKNVDEPASRILEASGRRMIQFVENWSPVPGPDTSMS